ncbi:hypothetical protein ACPROK_11090 [Glutamicibacter soli]|uniref:Uncharacterized protein n=1 Tax=Glutamicibacter soli TaxID=453836 RepID=A0A6L9G9L3_9MICC|nr:MULTISPECIES: hypothetical protein [Micrococcaceae]NAZ17819.1 hypothetical protein [Glutamicibacter soli]
MNMVLFSGMAEGLNPECQRVINDYSRKGERLVNSAPKWLFSRHLRTKVPWMKDSLKM